MHYLRHQHSYPDDELITASTLAKMLGISGAAISKHKAKGNLDSFENSKHEVCFHKVLSPQQYSLFKSRKHVTTATRAQMASGFDNTDAQAVSHIFGSENPGVAPQPFEAPVQAFDYGMAMKDRQQLEVSRAEKEFHNARWAKLKADEKEGRLVDKQTVYIKTYQLGAMIQEKVMNMYIQLAPKICGGVQDLLDAAEIDLEKARLAMKNANHIIGEIIRDESIETLQFLAEKTAENILD